MKELSRKDREIITRISQGIPDHQVCREFGLLPKQLEQVLARVARRAETYDDADNAALFYERALRRRAENAALFYERALRRRAENAAKSLGGRFHALLDASPDAILVVNAQTGTIREANERAAAMFGYALCDLIGRSVEDLVPERYRRVHPAFRIGFLSNVRKREMGYHPPIFAVREDGSELEISVGLTASVVDNDVMVVCSEFSRRVAEAARESRGQKVD